MPARPKTLVGFAGSANPEAGVYVARRKVNELFLRACLEDFAKNGAMALKRCAEEQPASYLKIFALIMPRELKIETTNPTGMLSDEALTLMVAELEERVRAKLQGESAKVIEGTVEPTPRRKPEPPQFKRIKRGKASVPDAT